MSETTNIQTFSDIKLTSKGLRLLAKAQTGKPLKFTRVIIGDGYLPEGQDILSLTSVVHEVPSHQTGTNATSATVDITSCQVVGDGMVNLRTKIRNGDKGFYLRELLYMAEDPDDGEIPFAYTGAGDGANAMPAFDGKSYVIRNIDAAFITSNANNITANITLPSEVTKEEFDAAMSKANKRLDIIENAVFDDEYGMRWTVGASAPEVERCLRKNGTLFTGDSTGLTFSVNPDGSFASSYSELPIWGEIERVTLQGQVMVRIPKYYIKRETTGGYLYTWVCKKKKAGYRCAAIFLQADGTENDYYYVGAYESTNDALGQSTTGKYYSNENKGYATGWTITEYRDAAQSIGDGWGITTMAEVGDLWQVLLPMEFGTRDVQSIAAGICATVTVADTTNPNLIKPYQTGLCDKVKNLHGIAHIYDTSPKGESYNYGGQTGINCGANPIVWHGIENPYGSIYKWVDGLTVYNGNVYTTNNRANFITDEITNYTLLGYTPVPNGTVKSLGYEESVPYCQLPIEITSTTGIYFADKWNVNLTNGYYYGTFGGNYESGVEAGVWCMQVNRKATYKHSVVGSRLSYAP